jgi:hypothetical protein
MRKIISMLLLSTTVVGFISCAKSINYFKNNLDETMTYEEIIETFGKPDEVTWPNKNCLTYYLNNNTQIEIAFNETLFYINWIRHEDKSGNTIETIFMR